MSDRSAVRARPSLAAMLGICGATLALGGAAQAQMPSQQEMWEMIQRQQREIEALKGRVEKTDAKVETTEKKVEATGAALEQVQQVKTTEGWWNRTSLGGYGELHYNGGETDRVDFHRFVLFAAHEFTDSIRLFSELEVEHALVGEGQPGEVELEQAFLEFDLPLRQRLRAGLQLIPVGILNEVHEPPTFFGVERNPVEANIIPTTWWEAGLGFNGEIVQGISYDFMLHSGLDTPTTGANAFKIRNGREKVANADAKEPAFTGRLRWTGIPGVEIGTTLQYQHDLTQDDLGISATLAEAHANIRRGGWGLRALFARWDLYGSAPDAAGRDVQWGWYVEPSYRWDTRVGGLGVFGRYNHWDNEAGNGGNSDSQQYDIGINYWPHPDVVFKADYQVQQVPTGTVQDNRINIGLGFQF